MAANSYRQRIILADKALVESVTEVKHVEETIQVYSDLKNFAATQFPVVAVVGRIPVPTEKHTGRDGLVDFVVSRLRVDLYCYLMANKDISSAISSLMDDIWRVMYTDQKRSGLVFDTEIVPDEENEYWPPFVAFRMKVFHHYKHGPGGI